MEIRQLYANERQAAIKFSDKIFRTTGQKSMGEAFPTIFSPGFIEQSFGAFIGGELVSFMGLVPSFVKIGQAKLTIFSLGSVFTLEEYRKKGIASKILEKVFHYIDEAGASLLLVSGDLPLYTRVNCCHFGQVKKYKYCSERNDHNQDTMIREMRNEDVVQMKKIAEQRTVTYEQSVSDLQMLLHAEANASCANLTHKVLLMETDSQVSSFIVLGLPDQNNQTKKGKMIEWAGQPNEAHNLISYACKKYELEEIEVAVPWYEDEMEKELLGQPFSLHPNDGTVYIVNPERLVKQLEPYLNDKLLDSFEAKLAAHEHVEITFGNQSTTLTIKDFVSFLFDVQPQDASIQNLQNKMGGVFPIPFPYTAGLNYV